MGAPLKTIKTLRATAKILLVATPLMVFSGFLTAKPFLLTSLDFATARLVHTIVAPLVFIPLLIAHSTAGVLYILNRSKRFKSQSSRLTLAGLWAALLLVLSALYFAGQPTAVPIDDMQWEDDAGIDALDSGIDGDETALQRAEAGLDGGAADANRVDAYTESAALAPARHDAGRPNTESRRSKTIGTTPKRIPTKPSPRRTSEDKVVPGSQPSQEKNQEISTSPPLSPKLSGSKLVRERCVGCHPLSSVYGKKRTASEWRGVIGRMLGLGAKLEPAERQAVLRHLIGSYGTKQ